MLYLMLSTEAWADSLRISVEPTPPTVVGYAKLCPRSAAQIAVRAVILQGVVAAACEVDPEPIVDWFHDQSIWGEVTRTEKAFLQSPSPTKEKRTLFAS